MEIYNSTKYSPDEQKMIFEILLTLNRHNSPLSTVDKAFLQSDEYKKRILNKK